MPSRVEIDQALRIIAVARDGVRPDITLQLKPDEVIPWLDRQENLGLLLDKIINIIDSSRGRRVWTTQVDQASRVLLSYWGQIVDDIFRAHEVSPQGNREYLGEWLRVGNEELRLNVEKVEGPVDVTIYQVGRRTPFEESEMVFALDEHGRLEEVFHPLSIYNRLRDNPTEDWRIVYEIKYSQGRISTIKVEEIEMDPEGTLPAPSKTTEIRFPSLNFTPHLFQG